MERPGQRVAVHFDVKFRRLTIATSRQGAGVTGGTPYGFTVGTPAGTPGGPFIKALNEGDQGHGPWAVSEAHSAALVRVREPAGAFCTNVFHPPLGFNI